MSNPTEIDARDLRCPLPVLRLRKALQLATNDDLLRLLTTDPAAIIDVPHFCHETGHTLLSQEDCGTHMVFLVRKSIDV